MHEFFAEPRSWVAVAFVIFFAIFGGKIWKALAAMLDKHTATIRADLEEASRLRVDAEKMLADATAPARDRFARRAGADCVGA